MMAFVSAILSLLSRKLGDLLQAIFGWSIAALFGRLPSRKQTGLAVAIGLSIAWPLLVVGVIYPGAAAWAVAFIPLHNFVDPGVLRYIWLALALIAPLCVAVITRWVAPPEQKKGGIGALLVSSVPLTLGFMFSFLLTFFIVPALRLLTMARGWNDDHVYLLIERGAYDEVFKAVRTACSSADEVLDERPVPWSMALPLKVLKWFARGALTPLVATEPKMLRGDELELFLYPGDLLIRGEPERLARVRTQIVTQLLNVPAHLVEAPAGQAIEDEIHRLWDLVARHHGPREIGDAARDRLRAIADELSRANLPLDQWSLLHVNLTALERSICGGPRLVDPEAPPRRQEAMMNIKAENEEGLTDLVKEALTDAKDLVKLEVELAKTEVREDLDEIKVAAIAFVAAFAAAIIGLTMLLVALVLAIAPRPLPALIVGGVFLLIAVGVAAFVGYPHLPKKPLDRTLTRLKTDAQILKEHTA
jgi:uncharacterized membrane protein YqjE